MDYRRFSVCIETVFPPRVPCEARMRTVRSLGFTAYEFWFHDMEKGDRGWVEKPGAKNIDRLADLQSDLGLELVCFAVNMPDGSHGGDLIGGRSADRFFGALDANLLVAAKLGCRRLIVFPGFYDPEEQRERQRKRVVDNLRKADRAVEGTGIRLLVEALSARKYDGFAVPTVHEASALLAESAGKNLGLLFDLYHVQTTTGNVLENLERHAGITEHIHMSGVPGQHEPAAGELNLPLVVRRVSEWGYGGRFGLEYYATKDPALSLGETMSYLTESGRP
jgi:hydroxypyruvate isomerase